MDKLTGMKDKPVQINLTVTQARELQAKIAANNLTTAEQKLLSGLVLSCLWLQTKIANSKMTIVQLKAVFGITTEKIKRALKIAKIVALRKLTVLSKTIKHQPRKKVGKIVLNYILGYLLQRLNTRS